MDFDTRSRFLLRLLLAEIRNKNKNPPGDDGQTDHDPHDGSHPIWGGRPLGVGRASGENHGGPPFILAYLRKAGRYRRTACIPSWKFQRIRGHRGQRTSKRPLDA